MPVITLHTRLKPGKIAEYERVHAVIPPALDSALRRAGVRQWRIWRSGQDLFHWVEVDDVAAMKAQLAVEPADREWQPHIGLLLEMEATGSDDGLPLVWELPTRPAEL